MRDVVRYLIRALDDGRERLLCQVVETRGSTPQKAGAIMAVDPDGGQVGTLGGGCVENEVKQNAVRQLGEEGVRLHSFVLDHDYAWADGLICGGKMVIATEALKGAGALDYYRRLHQAIETGEGFTEAVVVAPERVEDSSPGRRFLFDHDGKPLTCRPGGAFPDVLGERLAPLVDRPRARVDQGVAWLPVLPRIRLVVVGAGHVGQAVGNLAAEADFDVWVVDDRSQYASRERFPKAQKFIVGPVEEVLKTLEVTRNTFVLIVTRGHGHDQEALFHMAPTPASYVGLIGSQRKIKMIFESLREMGIAADDLARVTAPVGLDIGSRTVPEIAVSIVAELIARRNLGPKAATPIPSTCAT
ncbi:MAG: XdhC family protein [Paludisphaera borealis]|uniref:XdhC family protein n=1 Tax=Paludisphaera borealis TaxID=1387353 RepID=UPI00284DD30F|nr:XdhC family protein [Paludisphaera borealis]MDR3623304.1 XdhC family protein [Paludisphaera borealis]